MKKVLGIMLFMFLFLAFFGCNLTTTTPVVTTNGVQTTSEEEQTTSLILGQVTLQLYGSDNALVKSITVDFDAQDSLLSLMMENYTVYCDNNGSLDDTCSVPGAYGLYIRGIDSVIGEDANRTYISMWINDVYAMTGIADTDLVNGYTYAFKLSSY
ncbi:MAG: hypothetical protein WC479_11830 [Candidatus Izemoplasmatales bacterium]|nr:hypothetical protein [Candidatus Izemoplasmatales bacterium]